MDLLDLPPELVQKITHDLVKAAGIRNAWKLRSSCRTFASDIEYEILMKSPIADFKDYYDERFLGKCGDRYLECRLQSPLDVNEDLLSKVQKLVDWTVQALEVKSDNERRSVTRKICVALKVRVGAWSLIHDLRQSGESGRRYRWGDWSKAELDDRDKALGALSTGSYALLLKIFSGSKASLVPSWFEFTPFDIALESNDKMLLDTILLHLKSTPSDASSGQADLRRRGRSLSFDTKDAVHSAIRHNRGDSLQSLLNFYEQYLPRPDKATFDDWFADAASAWVGIEEAQIQRLMDFKPGGKTMLARHHLNVVCNIGTAAMIGDVLTRLGMDPNKGGILSRPIFVAVRSGRNTAIKAVIDAGADPSITSPTNIPSLSKARLAPIDVAIHKHNLEAISALVTHGKVTLPHISEWPTHQRTYYHLRNIAWKDRDIILPDVRKFKRMNDAERKAIKY